MKTDKTALRAFDIWCSWFVMKLRAFEWVIERFMIMRNSGYLNKSVNCTKSELNVSSNQTTPNENDWIFVSDSQDSKEEVSSGKRINLLGRWHKSMLKWALRDSIDIRIRQKISFYHVNYDKTKGEAAEEVRDSSLARLTVKNQQVKSVRCCSITNTWREIHERKTQICCVCVGFCYWRFSSSL